MKPKQYYINKVQFLMGSLLFVQLHKYMLGRC